MTDKKDDLLTGVCRGDLAEALRKGADDLMVTKTMRLSPSGVLIDGALRRALIRGLYLVPPLEDEEVDG